MFVNREHELNHLEEEYRKNRPAFVVIYGRRRIGKTTLIEEFGKDKPDFIYYLADQQTSTQQIDSFKQQIYEYTHDDFLIKTQFDNWDHFFSYLSKTLPQDKRLVLAIDEITYLIKSDPVFPSILQKYWDTFFSKTSICLIVCGSLVGMMLRDVLMLRIGLISATIFTFSQGMAWTDGSLIFFRMLAGIGFGMFPAALAAYAFEGNVKLGRF